MSVSKPCLTYGHNIHKKCSCFLDSDYKQRQCVWWKKHNTIIPYFHGISSLGFSFFSSTFPFLGWTNTHRLCLRRLANTVTSIACEPTRQESPSIVDHCAKVTPKTATSFPSRDSHAPAWTSCMALFRKAHPSTTPSPYSASSGDPAYCMFGSAWYRLAPLVAVWLLPFSWLLPILFLLPLLWLLPTFCWSRAKN